MKNFLLLNQSFGTEGSPNQTGETQTRENRIGLMSYLHRTLMLLLVAYIGIGNVWGQTKVTTSNFYKLYSTSKDDCSTLVTNASFPSYAGNTFNANMNGTLSSVPSISTPHNFAGLNTTDKYYRIKMASKKTLTLTNVANVKKVTFYGNGSSSTRTISVSVAKVSGSGSTFSVTPLSLANSNATIVAYATEDFTGKSGYDANTYYTYTFTADGDVSLWGVYVECGATTSYRTFKSGEKIYFKDQESNFDFDALWKVSSGNVYAYFWNDTENAWSSYGDLVEGSWNAANAIYEITVPGSGKEYTKVLFTRGNGAAWGNTWDKTEDQTPAEGKNLFYVYKTKYADHIYKGAWGNFTPAGKTVYFDNRNVSTWTTAYVRIGHGSNNSAWGAMTKVAGTKYLYSQSTSKYASHTDFAIANKAGWTGGNHIDQPEKTYSDGSWSGSEYKMTMQTNYQQYAIDSDMYLCPKATSVLEHECQYYQVTNANSTTTSRIDDKTIGLRLPSYTVTSSGTNCTVSMVKYTADDFSTSSALASGGTVMPTQYIGVTVSPTTGYKFSSVSLTTGKYEQHTAAAAGVTGKYAILGDCEVSATCVAKTCTIVFDKEGGSGTISNVTATYGSAMPSKAENLPTKDGYTFDGFWDGDNGTGTQYYKADGTSKRNWDKDTESNTTLYAKWNCVTPTFGTNLSTSQEDYDKDASASALTVAATAGGGTVTYQWYSNDENNTTTPTTLTNCTTATYTPLTSSVGTKYYYCVATNSTAGCSTTTTSNIAKIVVSAAATYSVTYNANNGSATGSVPTDDKSYTTSDSVVVKVPGDLALSNYTFVGWNTKSDGSGTYASPGARIKMSGDLTLFAVWQSASSCPGSSGGTVFALTMKTNTNSNKDLGLGESVLLGTTYATTLTGGNVAFTDVATRTGDARNSTKAQLKKGGSGNKDKIYFGGSDAMMTIYLDCALEEGDVITYTGGDTQLSFTTTPVYGNSVYTSSKSYTIPNASALIGKKIIYCWRKTTTSFSVTDISITRPASCTDVSITTEPTTPVAATAGSACSITGLVAAGTNPTYQWQTCNSDGTGGVNITAAGAMSFTNWTTATLGLTPTAAGSTYYQCVVSGDCGDPVTSNVVTVNASAAPIVGYTVTYKYNGATSGATPTSETGTSVTLPTPTRTGYVLDGWYTTAGERVEDGGATYEPEADITLYARWEEECDAEGVAKSTTDVAATGYTTYIEKGGDKVVFTAAPSLGFKYKDADGNIINNSTTAVVRNNAYKCQISSDSGNKGSIKTNSTFSNVDSISFYFAASDKGGCKIAVWCSTDDFSADSTQLLSATTYADNNSEFKLKTLAIPSGQKASALRFKFRFTVTSSGKTSYIDSLKVYSSTSGGGTCYHVYYHGNGAESGFVSDTTSYSDGAKATVLSYNDSRYPLTKEDYDFQGWATSAGGSAAYSDGEKITVDGADVHLYAVWAAETDALVTWTMNTNTETWGASATSTTDGTNITSIGTTRTGGGTGSYTGATAKVTMATAEVTGSAAPSNSANFTFTIGATKQVEISKFDCQVFNVSSGNRTYKAQISDGAGNVYNSTNTVAVSAEATLTDASFVFGSTKILRGAVTIRIYAWKTSGSPTEFRMGPDVKFYGAVQDYACATPSAPTISGVSEYVPGQTITLTASHDGENYDNLTTYTWYKGDTWGSKSKVQNAATGSAGYTFTKASCVADDAGKYWCEVANGTCNAHNSEGYNIIVYPTYSITYNLNGGTNPVDPAPKTSYTQFDEDYTLPIPTKDGFVFAGWYEASDFSGLPISLIETNSIGDKSFYAKWGSAVTATWTVTKVDDKLYRGGGGYKVKAVIDQTAWNDSYKDQLELTATEGVTLKNIVASVVSSHVQVTADFDITTGLAADATEITFTLDVPADGTYAPAELTHDEDLTSCAGSKEIRFLSSNKNDAGDNFADMSTSSNTTQYVGTGLAKLIATGSSGLNDGDKKIGYRADRLNVVFKLNAAVALDVYFNAGSTSKSIALYSFSSTKALTDIGTSDYSTKSVVSSGVTVAGASFESGSHTTTAGAASLSTGVVNITTSGGVKVSYSSLAAGYYVLIGGSDGYLYGFDVSGGGVTPTLSWTPALASDGDWDSENNRLNKETGDVDFTFVAGQDKNSLGAITYSSNNPSVATVNAAGTVHIVGAAGDATITATLAASGCFEEATATYNIQVVDNCIDEPGTISTTDLGCSGIQMTVSGHTTSGETVSYQWYKVDSPDETVGTNSATFTTTEAGEYYVVVTNTGTDHCPMASTNTVKVASKAAATATKIVDSWYVKNGRRTPDVALVQTAGATGFIVKNGETIIWESAGSTKTGFGGCGFHMGTDGIIYLNGTKDNGDATTGLTAGDVTLKITANDGCGSSASELSITIHCQEATIYKEIAFVVDGDKGKGFDQVTSGHADGTELYEYLDTVGTAAGKRLFRLTEQNIYSTTDEKAIRQHYSQYDAILITDDPSTNKVPNKEDYKTGGYVNAFGTMIDVRPILTMEAYVSALKNWGSKGIAGNPQSPNPRQYEMRLECKDHEIYGTGLPDPEDGTNVWEEVIDGETFRHVILVDSTLGIYNGVKYNQETKGNEKPALQGFTGEAAGSLLGLGRVLEGTLQAAIERQEEPAARLLVFGINAKALHETCALTDEGKTVIKNILVYLLKTNMEEVDDCSNYFTGKINNDWSNAGNWSKGSLPNYETKVRILAPCEVSGVTAHVAQVDIVSSGESSIRYAQVSDATCDGKLTINANGALIVEGKVRAAEAPHFAANDLKPTTVNDLVLNTSSANQAALIFNNDEGKTQATVNLYSLGRTVSETNQFQYFAIPMSYLSVNPTFANEKHGITIYTYVWLEATGWERRGYYNDLYAFEGIGITTDKTTAHEYTMKGTLASTKDQEIPITADGKKLNLIGNSWTAPIQISKLEASDFGDASSAVEQTVYIYCAGHGKETADGKTEAAGQWLAIPFEATRFDAWDGLEVIPSMQAFQIKTTGEGTLTLDYDKHVRGGSTDLTAKLRAPQRRAAHDGVELMRIRVADSKTHTDLYLFEGDQFSDAFDNGWEANYRVGTNESAKLYARVATGVMAVAAMSDLEGTPIYFIPGQETEYTFTFGGNGMGYYLNDLKLQQSTLISEGAEYSFTYEKGDAAARFMISATPYESPQVTTGTENVQTEDKPRKILYNNKLYIIYNGHVYSAEGAIVR